MDLFREATGQLFFEPGERGIAGVCDFLKCSGCKPIGDPGFLGGLQEMTGMIWSMRQ